MEVTDSWVYVESFYVILHMFFFLMIRRPPRSTLFPTRRSSDLSFEVRRSAAAPACISASSRRRRACRSEEHTSELQSRRDLVCRLLLEKKNNAGNERLDYENGLQTALNRGISSLLKAMELLSSA